MQLRRQRGPALIGCAICTIATVWPTISPAESLFDAITLAYQTNPNLRGERQALNAVNEGLVQARAGYGPQVGVTAQYGYQNARVQQFSPDQATNYSAADGSADLSAVEPLYTAGQTKAEVKGATADVLAARARLRQAEAELVQNVINAYVDVQRDRQTVQIIEDEIVALTREFAETKARGALGVLTRTDVAEAEARLLSAQAQLNLAQGRLNASNAEYLNIVGQSPGELEPLPILPGLPASADEAFDAADHNNAKLVAAIEDEQSAHERVNQAKAANGPAISLKLDAGIAPYAPYLPDQYDRSVSASVTLSQPLFTSGMNSSKIRKALDDDDHARLAVEATRRDVVQLVAQAWDQLVSVRSALLIEQHQVDVELVAVEGNRVEERVGQRSTIDLLNAELELANARLGLIAGRHDEYAAQSALLAAMGLLEVRFLAPSVQTVSPTAALKAVEAADAAPWQRAIEAIDGLVPSSILRRPHTSADDDTQHPTNLPPLPASAP